MKDIVCIGCSITHCCERGGPSYVSLLNEMFSKEYRFINLGLSGVGLKICIDKYWEYVNENENPYCCIIQIPEFTRQPWIGHQEDIGENWTCNSNFFSIGPYEKRIVDIGKIDFMIECENFAKKDRDRLFDFILKIKPNVKSIVLNYAYWFHSYDVICHIFKDHYKKIKKICKEKRIDCTDIIWRDDFTKKGFIYEEDGCDMHLNKFGKDEFSKILSPFIKGIYNGFFIDQLKKRL